MDSIRSPHLDWYENLDGIVDEIREEIVEKTKRPLPVKAG